MTTAIDGDNMVWTKSSYSGGQGGNCVEVGAWRPSSRSSSGGQCVEAGTCSCHGIAVRDSKNPAGGILTAHPSEWTALLSAIKNP